MPYLMDIKLDAKGCPLYGQKSIYPKFQSGVNPLSGLINNLKTFLSEKPCWWVFVTMFSTYFLFNKIYQ